MYGRNGGATVESLLARMRCTFAYQSKRQAQSRGELAGLRSAIALSAAECALCAMCTHDFLRPPRIC